MITKNSDKNGVTVQLSFSEILIINNALNEMCNAFGFSEFETRMGATVDEALALLKSVGQLLDSSYDGSASNNIGH
jgi:hypothetical protein